MNNKIHAKGQFQMVEQPALNALIAPGMLIETVNNNGLLAFQPHSTTGGFAENCFAMEDAIQGNAIYTSFFTDPDGAFNGTFMTYSTGDQVQAAIEHSGNLVYAQWKSGFNYTIGTKLISNGDGTLKPTTGSPSQIIGVVVQALNLNISGSVTALGLTRVM